MLWLVFLKQDFTSGTFQRHLFNSLAKVGVAVAAFACRQAKAEGPKPETQFVAQWYGAPLLKQTKE